MNLKSSLNLEHQVSKTIKTLFPLEECLSFSITNMDSIR